MTTIARMPPPRDAAWRDGRQAASRRPLLLPSMMCADFDDLAHEVETLDAAGADGFHLDIMDGAFVPNFALGLHDVQAVRRHTDKPIDVHLMVSEPAAALAVFAEADVDIAYVHVETDRQLAKTLAAARDLGMSPGIAINPGTAAVVVADVLPLVDYVLVMTVNPGFAAQRYLDFVDAKISQLLALKQRSPFTLVADGALSPERIGALSDRGVDGFVLGTSTLFGKHASYASILAEVRARSTAEGAGGHV